jgi:hypothetical protein
MEKPADILPESFGESASQRSGDVRQDDHHYAQERVRAYLKALGVPEQKAADCAAEALRRTAQEQGMHPVTAAMRALRAVLSEEQKATGYTAQPEQQILSHNSCTWSGEIASMPPLNRASMLAVEIDRKPWWTFFAKYILRKKS